LAQQLTQLFTAEMDVIRRRHSCRLFKVVHRSTEWSNLLPTGSQRRIGMINFWCPTVCLCVQL